LIVVRLLSQCVATSCRRLLLVVAVLPCLLLLSLVDLVSCLKPYLCPPSSVTAAKDSSNPRDSPITRRSAKSVWKNVNATMSTSPICRPLRRRPVSLVSGAQNAVSYCSLWCTQRSYMSTARKRHLGIRTGNPRVFLGNPYPTRAKPLPALTGTGFGGFG
jgi:hypothetical protein